ncbi:hypothetical protein ABPG75_008197 [Micractinium tetrahymenae]
MAIQRRPARSRAGGLLLPLLGAVLALGVLAISKWEGVWVSQRAGWTGFNCLHPMKRHCTHKYRDWGVEMVEHEPNFTAAAGEHGPNRFQMTRSHCAGAACDDDLATCWCPRNTTYGRIPAPIEAPQGSPPVREGRMMGGWCQPNITGWGTVDPDLLFGPEGWCTAQEPKHRCDCYLDGYGGPTCEERYEQFCLNQCNGRGECLHGYCKCDPGWHGIDCAHQSAFADASQPGREAQRPWIAEHVHTPAARDFPPGATRKRPLIFVYELASDYSTLLMQYRQERNGCTSRHYVQGNQTELSSWTFNVEPGFLEALLQSEHRTLDPEEADYFYVPALTSCYIEPVRGVADSVRDFWYGVHEIRVHGVTNILLEASHWIQSHHPYWDRRGGRDHIWLVSHDEASCYVPAAIRSSIILTHWGRMDGPNHTTTTGYWEDEYSTEFHHPHWAPDGFLWKFQGHQCYDPVKDLVVPLMKNPDHFHKSPLLGGTTRNRTILAFHRGLVQMGWPPYSRGIRQRLVNASLEHGWKEKHNILIGEYADIPGDYSELMASSVFCLVVPGHGWSARMDDATLNGCLPVIIMDDVVVSFDSVVDLSAFTVRIAQQDVEKLPEILQAISEERRQEMRAAMARVWNRFTYSSYRPYAKRIRELQQQNAAEREAAGLRPEDPPLSLPATVADLDPSADDAFGTVMAWLYHRIPRTR